MASDPTRHGPSFSVFESGLLNLRALIKLKQGGGFTAQRLPEFQYCSFALKRQVPKVKRTLNCEFTNAYIIRTVARTSNTHCTDAVLSIPIAYWLPLALWIILTPIAALGFGCPTPFVQPFEIRETTHRYLPSEYTQHLLEQTSLL